MNKKILIITCLVIITTVLSGCTLLGENKNKNITKEEVPKEKVSMEQNQENNKESSKSENKDGNYFETMTKLMARGKSMKCTYTQEVNNGETANGVVYMADGNAHTEITLSTGKMHAIIDQEYTYSWVDGSSTGYKMTLEAAEMDAKMKNKVSDLAKEIDYKCKLWKKDSSKFKVPSNITFNDLSEMMEGLDLSEMPNMDEMKADANKAVCDLCKNAPITEQAECLGDVVCDWQK